MQSATHHGIKSIAKRRERSTSDSNTSTAHVACIEGNVETLNDVLVGSIHVLSVFSINGIVTGASVARYGAVISVSLCVTLISTYPRGDVAGMKYQKMRPMYPVIIKHIKNLRKLLVFEQIKITSVIDTRNERIIYEIKHVYPINECNAKNIFNAFAGYA